MAAPDDIGADDKEAVCVDGFARTDDRLPPAGFLVGWVGAGCMLIAGEGMADQNDVGFVVIERAVGVVANGEGRQADA